MNSTLLGLVIIIAVCDTAVAQVPVPGEGCYHSAFTPNYPAGGAYGHDDFESLAQKKIAIEMFYTGWPVNRVPDFPKSTCDIIVQKGAIPHITWEPWTNGFPYALDGIITGTYDVYIVGWANAAKSWSKPLFLRVGHEMNGNWYPWCGATNGGSALTGFGDPLKADGPERFVAAYRRIHHLFDSLGVRNISWIWCPNNGSTPDETWNNTDAFYPGDDVVDWIGFDGYNWGTSQSWSGWVSFYNIFKDIYGRYKSSPKPLMIGEFASAQLGGDKGQWIRDAYLLNKLIFPRIKAITWFNINKETDWRINSTGSALSGYQAAVADSYYLSGVPTTAVESKESSSPADFRVEHAFPNPFNGEVSIAFTAPADEPIDIRISNPLGQVVASQPIRGTGKQSVFRWNGTATGASAASSGVYFVMFRSAHKTLTQKILYVK